MPPGALQKAHCVRRASLAHVTTVAKHAPIRTCFCIVALCQDSAGTTAPLAAANLDTLRSPRFKGPKQPDSKAGRQPDKGCPSVACNIVPEAYMQWCALWQQPHLAERPCLGPQQLLSAAMHCTDHQQHAKALSSPTSIPTGFLANHKGNVCS
jgi:hypothetical protein